MTVNQLIDKLSKLSEADRKLQIMCNCGNEEDSTHRILNDKPKKVFVSLEDLKGLEDLKESRFKFNKCYVFPITKKDLKAMLMIS